MQWRPLGRARNGVRIDRASSSSSFDFCPTTTTRNQRKKKQIPRETPRNEPIKISRRQSTRHNPVTASLKTRSKIYFFKEKKTKTKAAVVFVIQQKKETASVYDDTEREREKKPKRQQKTKKKGIKDTNKKITKKNKTSRCRETESRDDSASGTRRFCGVVLWHRIGYRWTTAGGYLNRQLAP